MKKELIIRSNSDTVDFAMLNDGKLVELDKEIYIESLSLKNNNINIKSESFEFTGELTTNFLKKLFSPIFNHLMKPLIFSLYDFFLATLLMESNNH